ncbi:C2 domain containing protein [Histomonas meleagridis]|uniref:C2 domain containing protein n=1 Tax=Histomonas meleagridis TaxID=135588 RepID=UPI00355A18D7|nr:C2 domain containing protein [Histomonas meleagridis]KAH0800256.1 C2 domain containing protein [Histomonas meleagridis]
MQLHLRVLEALDIAKMDISKSDPYCVINVSCSNDTRKTRVIENSLKPMWNEEFHFNIPSPANTTLKILMRDEDVLKDDDMATLQVKKGGRIHLVLHLAPNGAPAFQSAPPPHGPPHGGPDLLASGPPFPGPVLGRPW